MSKTVKIPDYSHPVWSCDINGRVYTYASGSTAEVPDEVAEVIANIEAHKPQEVKSGEKTVRTFYGVGGRIPKTFVTENRGFLVIAGCVSYMYGSKPWTATVPFDADWLVDAPDTDTDGIENNSAFILTVHADAGDIGMTVDATHDLSTDTLVLITRKFEGEDIVFSATLANVSGDDADKASVSSVVAFGIPRQ